VEITNIVATLRAPSTDGSRNADPKARPLIDYANKIQELLNGSERTYVVSGHYDSMCNLDATDATCDAPGANDDASGVAVVLELARVMSKRKFDATIIFMAVAGEEQGLYGSTYFAKQAVDKKMNIE